MRRLLLVAIVAAVPFLAGCVPTAPSPWNGQPWTNTHSEPCRKFEPITTDWVRAHPNHPCAKLARGGK